MKFGRFYILAVVLLLGATFGAYLAAPVPGIAEGQVGRALSRTTAQGLYAASIEPETGEIKRGELHAWILTLTTADGKPVGDARIEIDGGMPEHNHGLPTSPRMTEHLGEGRYRIEGVKFSMNGRWELRFDISAAAGADSVTFDLVL